MNWEDHFNYDPVTGKLVWVKPTSSRVKVGHVAASKHNCGYIQVALHGKKYFVHRIAWEMTYGPIPEGMEIDRINHDPSDNTIANLRCVTTSVNGKNKTLSPANMSGVYGVNKHSKSGKWQARIKTGGVTKYLGCFSNWEEAVAARKAAEVGLDFHVNHGLI